MGLFKDCGCGCGGARQQEKFVTSIMSALTFFIVSNPETYRLTRSVFGKWVSGPTGCASTSGLALHAIVFMLVVWCMMNTKKEGYAVEDKPARIIVDGQDVGPAPKVITLNVDASAKAPPKMVDMQTAVPGFSEEQFGLLDSGLNLGSMDIAEEIDAPGTTCGCDNGQTVTIS